MRNGRTIRLRRHPPAGGPGTNHLTYWIRQCEEAIAGERALRAMMWPAPFRYIGRPGTTTPIDGRVLRRGDVVYLSRTQFEAWVRRDEHPIQVVPAGKLIGGRIEFSERLARALKWRNPHGLVVNGDLKLASSAAQLRRTKGSPREGLHRTARPPL